MRFLADFLPWEVHKGERSTCIICGVKYKPQEIPHIWSHGLIVGDTAINGAGLPDVYQKARVLR